MRSRRILVTGLSTYWGGRLAQELEADPQVEAIIGVDTQEPNRELERAEYVRVGAQHALLRRIVQAAEIDTVIDTRLAVDSGFGPSREIHENNVVGTMNILAACSGSPREPSPVRKVIFKSSAHYYGAERDDPAFFTERMQRPNPPRTRIEGDVVEAERAVAAYAERQRDVTVTVLRFVNGLGPGLSTSHSALFDLPVVLAILGFDPRYQFIHADDIVGTLMHAVHVELDGIYNVAGDGVLALSEVASGLGKPFAPLLPPVGTGLAIQALRRVGINVPDEMRQQLRYGRAVDNRKLKGSGYALRYTSREAVARYAEHLRIKQITRGQEEPYRYEREVEDFLRYSPSVRRSGPSASDPARRDGPEHERERAKS